MKLFRPIQHKYGMLLSDLNEAARLPLRKNVLDRMRGSYGALVVTMDPKDFLLLTASPSDLETILARPFPEPQETY
jgi:hypothetical protein